MTAFEFMTNAFFIGIGAICLSAAALVVCGAVIGVYRAIKKEKRGQ